jgi:L-fuculose-phosphate aldolase
MGVMPSRSPAEQIVAAGRRLGARGLISAGEGNVSIRLEGGLVLITPSGRRKDELHEGDLLAVPIAVDPVAAELELAEAIRASSDVAIHRAVYATRPDVGAVVHAHLPAAMALTLAGEVPDPAALPETALLLAQLPYVPFATPGSQELAAAIAAALSEGPAPFANAVLLERHGAVAVGATVDEAVDRLELVEVLCRTWRDALLLRAAATGPDRGNILGPPGRRPGPPARGSSRRDR